MKNLIAFLVLAVSITACNNEAEKKLNTITLVDSVQTSNNQFCYESTNPRDKIILSIHLVGTDVSGEMLYAIQGKDRNEGTVHGEWIGDTLLVDYLFQAEGTISSRQLIFLKEDSMLVEGYGESQEVDGKIRYADRSKLSFGSGIRLKEVNCTDQPENQPENSTAIPVQVEQGSEELYRYRWELKEMNQQQVAKDKRPNFALLFTPGQQNRVSGIGGCNRLSGSFELSGTNGFKFGPIASTKMACPDMEQEAMFLKALAEINQWKIEKNELYLKVDGATVLIFEPITGKQ